MTPLDSPGPNIGG